VFTVAVAVAFPQVSVYVWRPVTVTSWEPESSVEERPGPVTLFVAALAQLQVTVTVPLRGARSGETVIVAVGVATFTVAKAFAEPAAPVQVSW
jgi:hypothetical protein